jgi:prepilin-type N-terminal cleavage/methylation domain-containing protein
MSKEGAQAFGGPITPSQRVLHSRGFTLVELVVVIGMIGILAVMAVPAFLSYYQAAGLKAGAQQFATLINQAREIAIKENDNMCVTLPSATQMTYLRSSCSGSAWVGAGTDAAGLINLPTGITVTVGPPGTKPLFNYVGSALPAATYTLTNTQTGNTLTVSVAASGRVTIP